MNGDAGQEEIKLDLDRLKLKDNAADRYMDRPLAPPPTNTFRDITNEFFQASEKLNVGQLVKDPNFTLFQAVGALEIMDPKMDSGLLQPEYDFFDAWKPRLPEELIGIMDRLLCNEMAWHTGSAFSQTLFANLYIDKLLSSCPTRLTQATFGESKAGAKDDMTAAHGLLQNVLRPYCLALIKCCGYANVQLPMEHIYEEEDFVPQTYGLPLLQAVDRSETVALLDGALKWLDDNESTLECYPALKARVLLRKSLLKNFSKAAEDYHMGAPAEWADSLQLIPEVESSHSLGKSVDEAWSVSVQRKLASSVPPRPLVETPFSQAIATLKQLCNEASDILKILTFTGASNLMTYFISFGARRPTPLPYTRSLIQSLLLKDVKVLGKLSIKDILFDDLQELCFPNPELFDPANDEAEAPHCSKYQISKRMDWFIERAGRSYVDLYRNLCQNRSRLRRVICKAMLDWDSLQVEAEEVDSELHSLTEESPLRISDDPQTGLAYSFTLSSWVYHYKLRLMELVVLLGFELEIYQLHEFDGMYWYLQYYLRARASHVERIRTFVAAKNSSDSKCARTLSMLNYHLLEITAKQDLSAALVYLYAALGRLDLLERPKNPHGSDVLRYEGRMKPFLSIGCPEVVNYELFCQVVENPDLKTSELLHCAEDSIAEAKKHYTQLTKLDPSTARATLCEEDMHASTGAALRSCVGIGVAIGVLSREVGLGTASAETLRVDLERTGYHPSFPVPKIKAEG